MSAATQQPISPLRQRMIDDMRMRQLASKTQTHYLRAVRQFAAFLGRSPDTASTQDTLFPARLDEYIAEDSSVRVIDAFVDTLNLAAVGFGGAIPADTGRPSYQCEYRCRSVACAAGVWADSIPGCAIGAILAQRSARSSRQCGDNRSGDSVQRSQ